MKDKIAKEVEEYGYSIVDIHESMFVDGEVFLVYTVELLDYINDYNQLLAEEREIRNTLNLSSQNIILELIG